MSDWDLLSLFDQLTVKEDSVMDPGQLQAIIGAAVTAALESQANLIDQKLATAMAAVDSQSPADLSSPSATPYTDAHIDRRVVCEDSLDSVKSLSEFSGIKKEYLTFRRAAEVAYRVFEGLEGSVKHYQAVSIIRNKITGLASDKLTAFGTPLNFKAIIARLDHEYGDRRPLHLLEQELSVLRQGNLSVYEYYDQVQLKLTALTNKTTMMYSADASFAERLNEKYHRDALRVFISGLKRGLSDTLFSSRPEDLPAALAMAEELEGNRERYQFASAFNPHAPDLKVTPAADRQENRPFRRAPFQPTTSSPFPATAPAPRRVDAVPEPMEVDRSLRSQFRPGTRRTVQGINAMSHELYSSTQDEGGYASVSQAALNAMEPHSNPDEGHYDDDVNFLDVGPGYHTF